jgi:CRP-like cAMP-binding protein
MRIHRKHTPDTTALCRIGLDRRLNRAQLDDLAVHTDVLRVPTGEVLVRHGRRATQFISIIDGDVEVANPNGDSYVAGPGTHFGAAELVGGHSLAATVTTRCDSTLVVIFGPAFRWAMTAPSTKGAPAARITHVAVCLDDELGSVPTRVPAIVD